MLCRTIGQCMRQVRHSRRLTLSQVAEMLMDKTGEPYSESKLSKWERDATTPSLDQAKSLAEVLGCKVSAFIPGGEDYADEHLHKEIDCLSLEEKQILYHAATSWRGDKTALINFVGLYITLPPDRRYEIALAGISEYDEALKCHELLPDAPAIDFSLIMRQWKGLV